MQYLPDMTTGAARAPRSKKYFYTASSHPDPKDMIKGIVNGVDITLIEPVLYPQIANLLESAILRHRENKEYFAVEQLKFTEEYINSGYEEELERDRLLEVRVKEKPPKPQPFTDDQLEIEMDRVLNNQSNVALFTKEELTALTEGLKKRRSAAISEEDFDEAERCDNAVSLFLQRSEMFRAGQLIEERISDLNHKLRKAEITRDDLYTHWRNVMSEFKQKRTNEIDEMCRCSTARVEKLETEKEMVPPPKFQKRSPRLLNMRNRERAMVSSKRYDDASSLQAEANKVQEQEDAHNIYLWHTNIDDRMERLANSLNRDIAVRDGHFAAQEAALRRRMKGELKVADSTVTHLEELISRTSATFGGDLSQSRPVSKGKSGAMTRRSLPALNRGTETKQPNAFRQRAVLNMKIYTVKPPNSARRK